MAVPAAAVVAKIAATVLTNDKLRKTAGWIIAAILSPLILIIVLICSLLSGTADHNNTAVGLCFDGGVISGNVPENYRGYIEDMRGSFALLDGSIASINGEMEDGDSLDSTRVKAIFYSLFFGADSPSRLEHRKYVECFVTYEERTRTVENEDGTTSEETYTVAVPIRELPVVYANIASAMGTSVTTENQANANRIYALALYGRGGIGLDGTFIPGEPIGDGSYQALIAEAEKYLGYPYVWGGSTPATSFDCSGYVCWVYTQSGVYNLPRTTAMGIYNQCSIIPKTEAKPGDLIFFTGTYATSKPVSHVGIYVGNNRMIHCGSPISYANTDSAYWKKHFYAFGRLSGISE